MKPKVSIRLPNGALAEVVDWRDTDEFQASFCFEPRVPAPQVKHKTWRATTNTIIDGLSASFGGFNNDLDVLFELEFFGGRIYRVPLFAANGRRFVLPLYAEPGREFTLRAIANVVFEKTCVIKAFISAAQGGPTQ